MGCEPHHLVGGQHEGGIDERAYAEARLSARECAHHHAPLHHCACRCVQSGRHPCHPKDKPQHVSYNVLRRSGIAIVFGLERSIYQLLLDDFPRARFYASASTLIEFFSEKSLFGSGKKMYVYLHEKEITIYAFEQGRMLFVNTFDCTSVPDMQYYTLNVWKELDFDQVDDALFVVGDMEQRTTELSEKIKYFLQNVTVIDRSEDFKDRLTMGNNLIPYDLQTLLICGF